MKLLKQWALDTKMPPTKTTKKASKKKGFVFSVAEYEAALSMDVDTKSTPLKTTKKTPVKKEFVLMSPSMMLQWAWMSKTRKKHHCKLNAPPTQLDKGKQLVEATLMRYQAPQQRGVWNALDKKRKVAGAIPVQQEDKILMEGCKEVWSVPNNGDKESKKY